ncbi:MAG: right-handed parallel beta-helix repeat-containing protein [Armatimonadetes bacterium]|nr:right-handed parallel beta-helix repeat-containing protein [Armatimonadota bacterium]
MVIVLWGLAAMGACAQQNAARPGETALEAPTFHCLGVRWYVEGDANGNAKVALYYRKTGAKTWKEAMPLFRVEGEKCQPPLPAGRSLFAGSAFDLAPGTSYDLRLTLADPDGGGADRVLRCATRREPSVSPKARMLYAAPGDGGGSGSREAPFKGLQAAQDAARPGDVINLAPGVYRGEFTVSKNGEEGKPIVWRGAAQGETILDGGGAARVISAGDARHVYLLRLTIRNGHYGIVAHGCSALYINRCHFYDIQTGFTAHGKNQKNITVTDCLIEGPCTWPRTKGIEEPEGVEVQGDGNVVAYNRIRGMADGISIFREPSHANDFYNNDISECTDDGTEMDYGGQNVRCFRNRYTNIFQGVSVQPLYGGPCYVFRNALYNIEVEPYKIHNGPSGILFFHNTTVKTGMPMLVWTPEPFSSSVFRNNLFIGSNDNYALEVTARNAKADWDYDGYGIGPFKIFASWNGRRYETFEQFGAQSGIERHALLLTEASLFASGIGIPADVKRQFDPGANDLRLRSGVKAIDAGQRLPNLNEGFAGRAPDLGAYEYGSRMPHYGPRP